MNPKLLVAVHCYAGDRHQVEMLRIVYQHHGAPVCVISPTDAPVLDFPPYDTKQAGLVQYFGQKSWDRQHDQLELLLKSYPEAEWFLLNDADSFCFSPELPSYLFEDENVMYSNQVDDFRIPGGTWTDKNGTVNFPEDYHKGDFLIAMQPPYVCSRKALSKIVEASKNMVACPITPFIDWWWVPACRLAGVIHKRFHKCVSCETETPNGIAIVEREVRAGAIFVHAVKRPSSFLRLCEAYWSTLPK